MQWIQTHYSNTPTLPFKNHRGSFVTMTYSELTSAVPPPENVAQVVEHFFRHKSGKMISTLTRVFGIEHLNRAEDVVQETLARALQRTSNVRDTNEIQIPKSVTSYWSYKI
ncbi:MAG: hypothetical protein ACREQ2_02140 [Candidatus Binatia bacterium]